MAPPSHTATASTSTLCKMLTWHAAGAWQQAESEGLAPRLLHQVIGSVGSLPHFVPYACMTLSTFIICCFRRTGWRLCFTETGQNSQAIQISEQLILL